MSATLHLLRVQVSPHAAHVLCPAEKKLKAAEETQMDDVDEARGAQPARREQSEPSVKKRKAVGEDRRSTGTQSETMKVTFV